MSANGLGGAGLAQLGAMDTAKVAGLLVVGAVLTLGVLRRSFGGVRVSIGS